MIGAGKYADLTRLIRKRAKAKGVMVIIVGGYAGHGFSLEMDHQDTKRAPEMLRDVARQIEDDLRRLKSDA